jgi:hypothetical protein
LQEVLLTGYSVYGLELKGSKAQFATLGARLPIKNDDEKEEINEEENQEEIKKN